MKKGLFIILGLIVLMACEHDIPESPEEATSATGLDYDIDTLSVLEGMSIVSNEPSVESSSDVSYSLVVTPFTNSISIDDKGIISGDELLAVGNYNITVIVNNEVGSSSFQDIIVIEVVEEEKTGIATLVYVEDTLSVEEGNEISSSVPVFVEDPEVSFTLTTIPSNDQITINDLGIISVAAGSIPGTFTVSVSATNENGVSTFNNIMIVTVIADIVTYDLVVLPLVEQKCAPCHTTGSQPKFTDYSIAKALISPIIERVELDPTSPLFMPSGGAALTAEEIDILKNWESDGLIQ